MRQMTRSQSQKDIKRRSVASLNKRNLLGFARRLRPNVKKVPNARFQGLDPAEIDAAFVQGVGTAGCIRGNSDALRHHSPQIRIVAMEPTESPVLSGRRSGAHHIEGIGAGFVVPL
jgi:cysteine synthase